MAIATRIFRSCAVFLASGLVPALAGAQEIAGTSLTSVEYARIRSSDARLSALIAEAKKRSPTFRALVASIEATDGVVFVEEGRCPRGVAACLTWQVTLAGPYRLLFVRLDPRKPQVDLMASVGHELQHAHEVLAEPSLRTTTAIQQFYTRGSVLDPLRTVETKAAEAAGDAVLLEVQRSRSGKKK